MSIRVRLLAAIAIACGAACPCRSLAGYHLERITPVLNQPTYLTQAPGDPPNILYYTTRISSGSSGFSPNPPNTMGKVWRFDRITRVSTPVLDLSARRVFNDDGLQTVAFHPDFNNTNTSGYGKMYVSSSEYIGPLSPPDGGVVPVNRVEEYFLDPANPAVGATNAHVILQFTNNAQNNHTIDWVGFDPTATNEARNYLYVSIGDTSFGNSYNGGVSPTGRPSQNPADVRGKILRIDVSGPDDYPADPLKDFAIPPSNPVPVYNVNHPGTPLMGTNKVNGVNTNVPALGEVYVTGVRNPYRASFDRANGDLYWGDVGENAFEEVDFLKAGSNDAGPPVDYGWPRLEGVHSSGIVTSGTNNLFTGATSLYPLREYSHSIGQAAIGGYVYRGPIPELQGKYFYADFVAGRIWMLSFNRDTSPATFNGSNGILTEVTSLWNSRIIDTNNAPYRGDSNIGSLPGLDHIVSFGEDNQGNLFLVDFGWGTGFSGQYTANGGEIFAVVPDPTLTWSNTGSALQLSWQTGFKLQVQTNNLGAGLGTNWVDYFGGATSPKTVPINVLSNAVFFRLTAKP